MFKTKAISTFCIALLLGGCTLVSPHRVETSQGNHFDSDAVAQLRFGMSAQQVKFLLGSPAIDNLFANNRWDYIYYQNDHRHPISNQRLSLWFDQNGKLSHARSNHFKLENISQALN